MPQFSLQVFGVDVWVAVKRPNARHNVSEGEDKDKDRILRYLIVLVLLRAYLVTSSSKVGSAKISSAVVMAAALLVDGAFMLVVIYCSMLWSGAVKERGK